MHLGTVAVLGAGTMAAAVLGGLAESPDISVDEIRTTNRTRQAAARWSDRPGVRAFALSDSADANRQAVTDADLILLGVKPAGVLTLLEEIADRVEPSALVVSLAAGITLEAMAARLPAGVTIVRTAANTPSLVRAGVTGLASTSADADQRDLINRLFAVLGEVLWVDEDELHLVAAVSGSGPAYLYFVLEQFARAAVEHGCAARPGGPADRGDVRRGGRAPPVDRVVAHRAAATGDESAGRHRAGDRRAGPGSTGRGLRCRHGRRDGPDPRDGGGVVIRLIGAATSAR